MVANDTVKVLHVLSACLFLGNVVVSGTWAFWLSARAILK